MGIPPPPGSTCGPTGAGVLASCFGSMEASAEVEAQHAATVLGTIRLGHRSKTNLVELEQPRGNASCKTAFAASSPACRRAASDGSIIRSLMRPGASGGFAARRGSPRCAPWPRRSRRDRRCRSLWWIRGPSRSRRTPPSNDRPTAARSSEGAPSSIARSSCMPSRSDRADANDRARRKPVGWRRPVRSRTAGDLPGCLPHADLLRGSATQRAKASGPRPEVMRSASDEVSPVDRAA
jgi:hypothetical protein